jgi:hypothetical protein
MPPKKAEILPKGAQANVQSDLVFDQKINHEHIAKLVRRRRERELKKVRKDLRAELSKVEERLSKHRCDVTAKAQEVARKSVKKKLDDAVKGLQGLLPNKWSTRVTADSQAVLGLDENGGTPRTIMVHIELSQPRRNHYDSNHLSCKRTVGVGKELAKMLKELRALEKEKNRFEDKIIDVNTQIGELVELEEDVLGELVGVTLQNSDNKHAKALMNVVDAVTKKLNLPALPSPK